MSMDVIVWATCALSLPADLPSSEVWRSAGGSKWAYAQETWQVVVQPETSRLPPEEVSKKAGANLLAITVSIEPIGAEREGYAFWASISEAIAKKCGGATLESAIGVVELSSEGQEVQ